MNDTIQVEIDSDGTLRTIYQEGIEKFAEDIGASITTSCRLSNVEWEALPFGTSEGWTVRSAFNPEYAIRFTEAEIGPSLTLSTQGKIIFFPTRKLALNAEEMFYTQLLSLRPK